MKKVLFLCTGNSCRSQMAEAIVNHRLVGVWRAFSAGSHPEGYVHPLAIAALKEIGIDHQGESKHMDVFKGINFDLVITVCDNAAKACPMWLGGAGGRLHMPFQDPFSSNDIAVYRKIRDEIDSSVVPTLKSFTTK